MLPNTKHAPLHKATRNTLWRTLQTFCLTRIVIAVVLLGYIVFDTVKEELGSRDSFADWRMGVVYVLFAAAFWFFSVYARRRFALQLAAQLLVDIGAISLLYVAAGGVRSGLAILYLFPLAGCAIMTPLIPALFFVSVVALILLGESGYALLHTIPDASPSRSGLYGAAFFAAIYLINRLAAKLIKQEELAAQRGRELQVQEAINRLVIADMGDGILVVGRDAHIFAANPAVERMLGLRISYNQLQFKLTDIPSLAPIAEAFFAWSARFGGKAPENTDSPVFVMVKPGDDIAALHGANKRRELVAHLKLRFVPVEAAVLTEDRIVIFLQDVTEIENQAQQLKLASMGRLTASIAHEVRNPLSAISHAASLLREEIADSTQMRLLNIVGDNVVRLNRMIEDILKLSRKAHSSSGSMELTPFLEELLDEFRETHAVVSGLIELGGVGGCKVRFDPLHLREVLTNLLSNAVRYASGQDGSIRLHVVSPTSGRLELHVQDDGPAITPEIRAHLFEPFYTTSSKGTGLGLYVARELCLNNGAMLDYEYRRDMWSNGLIEPSGRFVITFAPQNLL